MHPLLYETMTNRRAVLLALTTAIATACAVFGYESVAATEVGGSLWIKAGLGALYYPPLAINAWIDARRHILLKNWTHLAGVVAIVALVWVGAPLRAFAVAAVVAVPMMLSSRLSGGRVMGIGDARLIAVLALWNSIWHMWGAVAMIAVSFGLHALYVLARSLVARVTLHSRHALGPWLVAGSWLAFVFMT